MDKKVQDEFPGVNSVKLVELPHFFEENGDLVVMEGFVNIPFNIARVFLVRAPDGAIRGQHAHRRCSQFFVCPSGVVEVVCDDGRQSVEFVLDRPSMGLLIPPGIWAQQTYIGSHAALMVLCDRPYKAADYIRDYGEYKKFLDLG